VTPEDRAEKVVELLLQAMIRPGDLKTIVAHWIKEAVEEEREDCARIAEKHGSEWWATCDDRRSSAADKIADAIRVRGHGDE